jgi:hypothetical protein
LIISRLRRLLNIGRLREQAHSGWA